LLRRHVHRVDKQRVVGLGDLDYFDIFVDHRASQQSRSVVLLGQRSQVRSPCRADFLSHVLAVAVFEIFETAWACGYWCSGSDDGVVHRVDLVAGKCYGGAGR
jgi:hypothetical protein